MHESTTSDDPIIQVRDVTKRYGDDEPVTALDGISFDVDRGSVVGLLGLNGAGKSTVIKSILGLVRPDSGSILVDGVDVIENPTESYEDVSFTLEGARNIYWRLTVWENVRFFAGLHGIDYKDHVDEFERYLELLNIDHKRDTPVRHLSRGMKQKCYIACALARRAPILFLDEPTLGLDLLATRTLRDELRRLVDVEDRTIVLSSHNLDLVEAVCDEVVIVDDGQVVMQGSVSELTDVLDTNTYTVRLDGEGDEELKEAVDQRFTVTEWGEYNGIVQFSVVLADDDDFYALSSVFEARDATVISVTRNDSGLEGVFAELADDDSTTAEVLSA